MFSGASGTGKTYCGEIVAEYLGFKPILVSVATIESKWLGESEQNVSRLFNSINSKKEVLILDEIDSFLTSRGEAKHHHDNKLTNQFLIELERHNGVCVMTTNRPVKLDKALQRRIDLVLDFPQPSLKARYKIWEWIIPDEMPKEKIDFGRLAEKPINGGIIRNSLMSAARKMITRGMKKLTTELLIECINEDASEIDHLNNGKDHA